MRISITTDFPRIQRELEAMPKKIADIATTRALNRTVEQARTQMVRSITREYAVSSTYVRDRLRIRRAFANGALRLTASLSAAGGNRSGTANLINFGARLTRKGLSVKIRRDAGRKIVQDAFIANKGRTVFKRVPGTTMTSRAKYRGTKHAEKIAPVQTLDVPRMFNVQRINSAVVTAIRERFPAIFAREARFALGKFGGK